MNLANLLTCSRVVLAVMFTAFLFSSNPFGKFLALFVFILASVTDYWDGIVARERGEESHFGRLMDPIADKILTLSAFLGFWKLGLVPLWMVAAVVARDLIVTLSRFALPAAKRAARPSGKQKTVLQIVFIIATLIYLMARQAPEWDPSWNGPALQAIRIGMGAVVAVTLLSGGRMLWKNFLSRR